MKIRLARNDLFVEDTCVICGEEFPPDIITATAYSDDHSHSYGVVCPKCIHNGPQAIKGAMIEQIRLLRERAERLLRVAAELETETQKPFAVPTWPEWRETHLKTFLRHIDMLRDERVKSFRREIKCWEDSALQCYLDKNDTAPETANALGQAMYAVAWHERQSRQEESVE